MRWALISCVALVAVFGSECHTASAADPLPVLFKDDFEKGMDHWQPMDPKSFNLIEVKGADGKTTHAMRAEGTSKYKTKFRYPPNFALLKDVVVGDFEITARTQNTRPEAGPHRDMCVFWGYQDDTHFYYVHMGAINTPDTNSCRIFVVDNGDRKPISLKQPADVPWTDGWIDVKVTRNVATGETAVYFNDMKEPRWTAKDDRFKWGQVGLGTFDDHGNWDDFELRGVKVDPPKKDDAKKDDAAAK